MMAEAPEAEAAATKHAYESLSESDDEPDEVTRLRVTRPNILKDEHKNVYKGRQVMSNFFDILEQAERDEIEEANQPPPKYYWSEGEEPNEFSSTQKMTHNVHWAAFQLWGGLRFVGEVAIKTLGLDQPEYQWMLDQV